MASGEIRKFDVGTIIELTIKDGLVVVDVSTATVKQIVFEKPTRVIVTKDAEFSGTGVDGKIRYTTIANDLDTVGNWHCQGYIETPSGKWRTDIITFTVYDNLT